MTEVQSEAIEELAAWLGRGPAALLTGAGISTDSGIPDYRGAGTPPRKPMDIAEFMQDPAFRRRWWAGARVGASNAGDVRPNAGHRAVVRLERAGLLSGVITQNVDDLHRRAGSAALVELHGNGSVIRCVECGRRQLRPQLLERFDELNPGYAAEQADAEIAPDGDARVGDVDGIRVPSCPVCGGILRPDVVYFGELVPKPVFEAAAAIVARSASLIIAGSSLAVNTGVRLVRQAERLTLPIAVINRGPTKVDASASLRLEAGTSEVLQALAARAGA